MLCKCGNKIEGQPFFTACGSTMMAFFMVRKDWTDRVENIPVCNDCYHWNLDHNGGRITVGKPESGARLWTIEVSPLARIDREIGYYCSPTSGVAFTSERAK